MDQQTRLAVALNRLASGTNVMRSRRYDGARARRNGSTREDRLETVILHLESAAAEMWEALDAEREPIA